jgi:hypothetical protein
MPSVQMKVPSTGTFSRSSRLVSHFAFRLSDCIPRCLHLPFRFRPSVITQRWHTCRMIISNQTPVFFFFFFNFESSVLSVSLLPCPALSIFAPASDWPPVSRIVLSFYALPESSAACFLFCRPLSRIRMYHHYRLVSPEGLDVGWPRPITMGARTDLSSEACQSCRSTSICKLIRTVEVKGLLVTYITLTYAHVSILYLHTTTV